MPMPHSQVAPGSSGEWDELKARVFPDENINTVVAERFRCADVSAGGFLRDFSPDVVKCDAYAREVL